MSRRSGPLIVDLLTDEASKTDALTRIIEVANQQLDLLEDARRRPDVDLDGLSKVALEMLLRAVADAAEGSDDPALAAFAARLAEKGKTDVDVRRHLIALGEGWGCKHCKNDVVGDAVVSMLDDGRPKVELRCASCGRVSPISNLGLAAFKKRFGHLVGPDWDPTQNGFLTKDGK